MIKWSNVYSSHVNRVGHDSDTGEMLVQWQSGKVSAYEGVSAEKVEDISKSASVGERIKTEIKPTYKHRYRE